MRGWLQTRLSPHVPCPTQPTGQEWGRVVARRRRTPPARTKTRLPERRFVTNYSPSKSKSTPTSDSTRKYARRIHVLSVSEPSPTSPEAGLNGPVAPGYLAWPRRTRVKQKIFFCKGGAGCELCARVRDYCFLLSSSRRMEVSSAFGLGGFPFRIRALPWLPLLLYLPYTLDI